MGHSIIILKTQKKILPIQILKLTIYIQLRIQRQTKQEIINETRDYEVSFNNDMHKKFKRLIREAKKSLKSKNEPRTTSQTY